MKQLILRALLVTLFCVSGYGKNHHHRVLPHHPVADEVKYTDTYKATPVDTYKADRLSDDKYNADKDVVDKYTDAIYSADKYNGDKYTDDKKYEDKYTDDKKYNVDKYTDDKKYNVDKYTDVKKYEEKYTDKYTDGKKYEDKYTDDKKYNVDTYTDDKKYNVDTYTDDKKYNVDKYTDVKKYNVDTYTDDKKYNVDKYTDVKKYEDKYTDKYTDGKKYEDKYAEDKKYNVDTYTDDKKYNADKYTDDKKYEDKYTDDNKYDDKYDEEKKYNVDKKYDDKYNDDKYTNYTDDKYNDYNKYPKTAYVPVERRSIQEIYKAALKEGGKLVIYAGGDAPAQQTAAKLAFEKRFPGISVEMIVDLSKIHDARLDNQLLTGTLVADVVQLQTLQDFDRWRDMGVLHPYKPIDWDQVYPQFKDPDGYSTGIHVWAFANNINRDHLGDNEDKWPLEAKDYLHPSLKYKVVSTYPNDDDAVLFIYKLIIDKYGWEWLERFVANKPIFVRSTQIPSDLLRNGTYPCSFTTAGTIKSTNNRPVQFILPKYDSFVSWGQRAAIMAGTKYLATAQLYLSWWLEVETQRDFWFQFSVRQDIEPPKGFRKIFDYPGQTDPVAFEKFMGDRTALEIFKNQVQLYVGEVQGDVPTGTWELGLHPTKMLAAALARK